MQYLSKEFISESLNTILTDQYKVISEDVMKHSLVEKHEYKIASWKTDEIIDESFSTKEDALSYIEENELSIDFTVIKGWYVH